MALQVLHRPAPKIPSFGLFGLQVLLKFPSIAGYSFREAPPIKQVTQRKD